MVDTAVDSKLTARQERAIIALLGEPSIRQAAVKADVPETSLYRWLKEDAFDRAYRQARRAAVQQALAKLQQASSAAVTVLVHLMAKDTVHPSVRLAAASKILDLAIKSVELEDLAARLEALEKAYAEKL